MLASCLSTSFTVALSMPLVRLPRYFYRDKTTEGNLRSKTNKWKQQWRDVWRSRTFR